MPTLKENYKKLRKKLLVPFLIFILALVLNLVFFAMGHQKMIISRVDINLTKIAMVAPDIMGKDFFEIEHGKGKITPEQNEANARKLSEYAKKTGAIYVYIITIKDGDLYYTCSSSTDEEWKQGDVTPYFSSLKEYGDSNIEILKKEAKNLRPLALTGSDSYGKFRSVYIPYKNSRGEINIVGADYTLEDVNKTITNAVILAVLNMAYVVAALIPLFIASKKLLMGYIREINKRATIDELTGLYNRSEVFNMLGKYIEMCNRSENGLTICFIDIDNLKKVNDEFGHDAGDRMLKSFSEVLKNGVRKYDITSRIGGDEFLVIFPSCSLKTAKEIIERVKVRFEEKGKEDGMGEMYDFSYGLSEYIESEDINADKLIKIADNRMYQYKIMKKYRKLNEN